MIHGIDLNSPEEEIENGDHFRYSSGFRGLLRVLTVIFVSVVLGSF